MPQLAPDTETDDDHVRPFEHHGVDLAEKGAQHVGVCPFCGKEKFTAETATGLWQCWACSHRGNPVDFLRQLWEASDKSTDDGWLRKLAEDRTLLDRSTLQQWGVCKSVVDGLWLVPGYSVKGELVQLYRRVQTQNSEGVWSWKLLPTPGVWPEGKAHALHMASMDFDPARGELFVMEGPWDGMAFWEVARQCRRVGDTMELSSQPNSMLADANVVAVPGCSVWQDVWTELCRGKAVTLMYDNDYREHNGSVVTAGYDGLKRVAGKIAAAAKSVSYLSWGGGGFDASLPSGFDVRDALANGVS